MGQTETVETLGMLGGIGSVLSPILTISYLFMLYPFYYSYAFALLGFLAFVVGIIACALSLSAVGKVRIMPQQSRGDLQAAGLIEIVVGFICIANWIMILSGILILIASFENDTLWKKISQARQQTGFPYTTVATAAGNSWNRRLSCRFCGAPLVVIAALSRGPWVKVKGICPLDKTTDVVRLPLALLEEWAPTLADRLHRCEECGERTAAQIVASQTYRATRLRAYCPLHNANRTYRYIWTPLYPHAARSPTIDVGFRSGGYQPRYFPSAGVGIAQPTPFTQPMPVTYAAVTPQTMLTARPFPISVQPETELQREGPINFCMECGVRIEPMDRFCYSCGRRIQ